MIGNAIKFTFSGSVTVNGKAVLEGNVKYLEVKVKDTGLGIKKEDIPQLFNVFSKLDHHESVNKTGAGLGLTIS